MDKKNDIKDIKDDVKKELKSILRMLLSSSKTVFFKFILGKYMKVVCKKNNVDLEELSKLDPSSKEFETKCQEALDIINKDLTVKVEEELSYILKAKQDYRLRKAKK